MNLVIRKDDPLSDDGRSLIAQSEDFIRSVFPPEECFTFSPAELATPNTCFYIARDGADPVGCVALVQYDEYAEIKRLYVSENGRGSGVARKLMQQLEQDARNDGVTMVRLETGEKLVAAVQLYSSLGYKTCNAYGDYPSDNNSLFMEKRL